MKKLLYTPMLLLTLFCFSSHFYAQPKHALPQVTPHSPNAASLGKYGEIPTTLSNGRINLEVPLLTFKVGSFELPVSLTYHNNGLKVDEIPSWVGLGWDLTVPGVINYNQRGLRDFSPTGIFSSVSADSLTKYFNNEMSPLRKAVYFEQLMNGQRDGEYDMYSYNFLGRTGSFYLNKNQSVVTFPKNDLKIARYDDVSYEITDESGNRYLFITREYNKAISGEENSNPISEFEGYATAYITQITTADNRIINFDYDTYSMPYSRTSKKISVNAFPKPNSACPSLDFLTANTTYYDHQMLLLKAITSDDVKMQFVHSAVGRSDLKNINTAINVPYLSKIILTKNNVPVSEVTLNQSYFLNTYGRLKLDSITIKGNDNAVSNANTWRFTYYQVEGSFPNYFTTAKDHWGYYNGNGGVTSIPQANNYSQMIDHWSSSNESFLTNRTSNFEKSKLGMLEKITYPTGGVTEFIYEANQFKFSSSDASVTSNPFLLIPPTTSQVQTTILDVNTNNNAEEYGSFTLTASTQLHIKAERAYDPQNLVESYAVLSNTNPGNNLLYSITPVVAYGVETREGDMTLPAGTYYYALKRGEDEFATNGYASMVISKITTVEVTDIPYTVGGGRISRINNYLNGQKVGTKKFEYNDKLSELVFANQPYYLSKQEKGTTYEGGGFGCGNCGIYSFLYDESLLPFSGDPLEYVYVTEYDDENGVSGKTAYKFSTAENLQQQVGAPYLPPFVATWRSGKPLETKMFRKNGAAYDLVQQNNQAFTYTYPYDSLTQGLKVDFFYQCDIPASALNPLTGTSSTYSPIVINFQTEKYYPSATTSTYYSGSGSFTQSSVFKNTSARHVEQTDAASLNATNDTIREKTKYSFDFGPIGTANDDITAGLKTVIDKNKLIPVEKVTVEDINGVKYVTGGELYTFNASGLYAKMYRLNIEKPVLESSFTYASVQSGLFVKDSRYKEKELFTKYDEYNNLLESRSSDDVTSSYLWGYNKQYAIATITGVNYATLVSIVDTLLLNNPSSTEAQMRTELGKLRTDSRTKGALIITYTYKPLVGITSVTDPAGRISYYEYDSFNRLRFIKDEQGNVVKKICYNYAGQQTECN
ncbi:hypothetical protein ACQWU4_14305 [Chryseobacterium sp. MIQD13]|uniref:hypothetical protein n=1 Tax=Chryseobacterium sp. MIQD13 TaxID=3422310 RepID=UPI003D27F529